MHRGALWRESIIIKFQIISKIKDTNKKSLSRGGLVDFPITIDFHNFEISVQINIFIIMFIGAAEKRDVAHTFLQPPQNARKECSCKKKANYVPHSSCTVSGGVLYLQLNLLASAGISQKWVWMHTNFHRIGTRNWVVSSQVPQNDVLDRGIHNGGWKRRSLFSRPVNGLVTYYY